MDNHKTMYLCLTQYIERSQTAAPNVGSPVVCVLQVSDIIVSALNQNLVEFELKPGVRVIVYNTQLTLGKNRLVFFVFNAALNHC